MGNHSRAWEVRWPNIRHDGWMSIRMCNRDIAERLAERIRDKWGKDSTCAEVDCHAFLPAR